ncbi:hypothetical protein [Cysteiniphilum litorale]|uniref:hypothetical protein n=1 Tax=Cysteiniphilum litorale TaxID=2056700 RepID=UPI003F8805FE
MQLKPKKLLLNTKQPFGLWFLLLTSLFYSMGTAAITVHFSGFIHSIADSTQEGLTPDILAINFNLVTNLFLYSAAGLIGGILGYMIGHRRSVIIGMLYSFVALILLSLNNLSLIGFSAYIIGVGLVIPNLFTTLSFLYTQDDPRRHAGFTLMYMATILGAALSLSIGGSLQNLSYQNWFIIMAVVTLFAVLIFLAGGIYLNRNIGLIDGVEAKYTPSTYSVIFILIVLSSLTDFLLHYQRVLQAIIISLALIAIIIMLIYAYLEKDETQRKRNRLLLILLALSVFFWLADKSIITIFLNYLTLFNRDYGFFNAKSLSADFFFEANIALVLIIGFVSAVLWNKNKHTQHMKRLIRLFSLATLFMALASGLLFFSFFSQSLNHFAMTGNYLLLITLMLNSVAKVLLLPLYYAMVGKFSPRKYESIVMGFFFIITAGIGVFVYSLNQNILNSQILTNTYQSLSYLYGSLFVAGLICALVAYLLSKFMHYHKKNV